MSLGSDVFGYVAGAVGLIGFIYAIIQSHRPKTKIKYLNELIKDTEETFFDAKSAGLLNPNVVEEAHLKLSSYRDRRESLRTRAFCANTLLAECLEMVMGLSKAITITCSEVDTFRASILTISQQERQRLLQESSEQNTNNYPSMRTDSSQDTVSSTQPSIAGSDSESLHRFTHLSRVQAWGTSTRNRLKAFFFYLRPFTLHVFHRPDSALMPSTECSISSESSDRLPEEVV